MEETKPQFVVNFAGMNYESDAMRCESYWLWGLTAKNPYKNRPIYFYSEMFRPQKTLLSLIAVRNWQVNRFPC